MDFNPINSSVIGLIALAIGWLFKNSIQYGKDITRLQTVFEFYIGRQTKDAAIRLETVNNPTPPEMQLLLQKYRNDVITKEELGQLVDWLKTLDKNPDADPAERSAALQLLTGMLTVSLLDKPKKKWL